jgi:hypothetical protein
LTREEFRVTSPATPFIECDQLHAGLTVRDVTASVDFYVTRLGFKKAFTEGDRPSAPASRKYFSTRTKASGRPRQ